jgi:tetratricopeptide (TPR) repeat protein
MLDSNTWSNYGRHIYRLKKLRSFGIVFLSVAVIIISVFVILQFKNGAKNERKEFLRIWNEGNYEQAYKLSKTALEEKPLDYFLLTINGFSAYQMGIAQINSQNTLIFINECIFSLRKALLQKESNKDGRLFYVLGKAYAYKGGEYADLAVKYLEKANNLSYDAYDIHEYLGLAYASYGDYRGSVEAFTQAFVPGKQPSDNLLLSISRSYIAMEDYNIAISYLTRCSEFSADSKSVIASRFMLAEISRNRDEYDRAEKQYLSIINDFGENAEAHYQLGELYNQRGDTAKARSEWRTTIRQDPAHAKARARLNI